MAKAMPPTKENFFTGNLRVLEQTGNGLPSDERSEADGDSHVPLRVG